MMHPASIGSVGRKIRDVEVSRGAEVTYSRMPTDEVPSNRGFPLLAERETDELSRKG
jgi:hypothetical protein